LKGVLFYKVTENKDVQKKQIEKICDYQSEENKSW
jgi:hypothetical protein